MNMDAERTRATATGGGVAGVTRVDRVVLAVAAVWTVAIVGLTFALKGWDADNVTRAAVLTVLAVDGCVAAITWRRWPHDAPGSATAFSARAVWTRWVLPCCWRAALVELCYMPSRPLYDSVRWLPDDDISVRVEKAAIDLALTAPFYVVAFSVVWLLLRRVRLPVWHAVLVLPFAQALGDGNAFFLANPAMLLMSPYVVLNYFACQFVPYLRVRAALPLTPAARPWQLALPLLVVPAVYWCGGAALILVGRAIGLRD
jgi:hypothetical protein